MTVPDRIRQLTEDCIVVASHNSGKVREISELLRPFAVDVLSAAQLKLSEPEETGATFAENAALKAHAAARASGKPALSDDSGLCVHALGDEPGLFSARWAGPERDFAKAMQKVEDALQGTGSDDRRAHFVCALCLAWPSGDMAAFEGRVYGDLVWPPRGERGFGYDPMFVPDDHQETFGEMDPDYKHRISHRARAFEQLVDACLKHRIA